MVAWTEYVLQGLIYLFVLAVGIVALALLVMLIVDRTQTRDAIRRNYPVIGRFRHLFTTLGEFFRQYFFAMDREELPFNRAQRHWIERAADGHGNTVAFGSTRDLRVPGTPIFVNSAFPPLGDQATPAPPMLIGPENAPPISCAIYIQSFRHELWRNLGPCCARVVKRGKGGRYLDEHRGGCGQRMAPERWCGYRVPDRYGQIRGARRGWQTG